MTQTLTPVRPHAGPVPGPLPREPAPAFTLIELLVVVTIIVILLALLTPALDRAIGAAEMAQCGATQDAFVASAITYAMAHKRSYAQPPMLRGEITASGDDTLLHASSLSMWDRNEWEWA